MNYHPIDKSEWHAFFDAVSRTMEGRRIEIEVLGPDIGDQIEVEWLPVNGMTYDPAADTLHVHAEDAGRDIGHAIPSPREVHIELGPAGLARIVVIDRDAHTQIMRFRAPLELPARADEEFTDRRDRGSAHDRPG
jgi:hypothetical protein